VGVPRVVHFMRIGWSAATCGIRETRFVLGSSSNWKHVTCKRCLRWQPSGIRRIGEPADLRGTEER
jgi:hypothetical protein